MALNITVHDPATGTGGAMPLAASLSEYTSAQVVALGSASSVIHGPCTVCLLADEDVRIVANRSPFYTAPPATGVKIQAGVERYYSLRAGMWYISVAAAGSGGGGPTPTPSPTLGFSSAQAQPEGTGGTTAFTYTLTLARNGSAASFPFSWAVAGAGGAPADAADFGGALPTGSGTFAPGDTTKQISFAATGDSAAEPDEHFTLTVMVPNVGSITVAGTILDDDSDPEYDAAWTPYRNIFRVTGVDGREAITLATPNVKIGVRRDVEIELTREAVPRTSIYYFRTNDGNRADGGSVTSHGNYTDASRIVVFFPYETQKIITIKDVLLDGIGDFFNVSMLGSGWSDNASVYDNGRFGKITGAAADDPAPMPVAQPAIYQPQWLAGRTPSLSVDWTRDEIAPLPQGTPAGGAGGVMQLCDQSIGKRGDGQLGSARVLNDEKGVYASPNVPGDPEVWKVLPSGVLRMTALLHTTHTIGNDPYSGTLPGACTLISTLGAFSLSRGCYRFLERLKWNGCGAPNFWGMNVRDIGGVMFPSMPELDAVEYGLGGRPAGASHIHAKPPNTPGDSNDYNSPYKAATGVVNIFDTKVRDGTGEQEYFIDISDDWISFGYREDGEDAIKLYNQVANPGPGVGNTGRVLAQIATTVGGLGNSTQLGNYQWGFDHSFKDVIFLDGYQTAAERAADGNVEVAQKMYPPLLRRWEVLTANYAKAIDYQPVYGYGDGGPRQYSLVATGNAPAGTTINGATGEIHIPAKGSGGTISGIVIGITDATFPTVTPSPVPAIVVEQVFADDWISDPVATAALDTREGYTTIGANSLICEGDGAISGPAIRHANARIDAASNSHFIESRRGADGPYNLNYMLMAVAFTDPENCVYLYVYGHEYYLMQRVAGAETILSAGGLPFQDQTGHLTTVSFNASTREVRVVIDRQHLAASATASAELPLSPSAGWFMGQRKAEEQAGYFFSSISRGWIGGVRAGPL